MLERASSCLEPAAQNLFRSIEAPTRSQRRLPQAFWRHARVAQANISWWPAYLDDIRRATQAREGSNDGSTLVQQVGAGVLAFAPPQWSLAENASASSRQQAKPSNRRYISKIVKQSRTRDDKALEMALEPEDGDPPPAEVELFAPESIPEPRKPLAKMTTGQRLEELLRAGGEPKYNAVWLAFISLKQQAGFARAVLRYLSHSPSPVVLRRALRTFQMIEVEDRTHLTYESAVRAAIGLRKYATANDFILEALQRGLGVESSQFLMGHLVEKEMWKSAVQALHVFVDNTKIRPDQQTITNRHVFQHMCETPVWRTVDRMLSLPQKLIRLSRRLEENDTVLALERAHIESLATRLLERVLRSTTIMGVITPEGVLALFDSFRKLGLLRLEHYLDALSALRSLREVRNRSQLALLIFRNMRWVYSAYRLHDSAYGTMISILSAAPNEPKAFEYILKDVTLEYDLTVSGRKRDLAMYQRVMSACAEQGHTTYVERLLQRLIRDHGVPKDLAYFTPVLLSYAKRGDVEGTKRSFDELSSRYGLKPNRHCWNILLLAYARADDFEGAAALFRQMGSLGISADAYTFGTLMSMCSNAGDTRAVLQLVEMARKQRIPASTAMIDTIVHTYCLNEEAREAESLVEAATQMSLSGSPTRMWNILLRHHAFRADSGAVLRTQERMRELAVRPDAMTYAALMTSLVIVGKTKDAAAILRSLHIGQVVTASRFHYSIVFHGYVQEGRRDQAMVIYAEMLERFHRPSPSAQLAMLHLQSQRDDLQAQRQGADLAAEWTGHTSKSISPLQSHSIDYLADALLEMADAEALSDEPQPGFQRRKPISTAAGVYLEVPIAVLNLSSSYEKAQKLVSKYQAAIDASPMSKQQKSYQTVQLLTAHLRGVVKSYEGLGKSTTYLKKQSRDRIDAIWSRILAQTLSDVEERRLGLLDYGLSKRPREATSTQISVASAEEVTTGSDVASEPNTYVVSDDETSTTENVTRVIPAKRYALSVPLSVYMRGLALQQRMPELESLLNHLQDVGFELTSKNWNTYVQLLSDKNDTVLQAFCIFEQKLLRNVPPWKLLKRGKVSFSTLDDPLPADADTSGVGKALLSRTMVERRDPGQLVPTYFTVIHLAAAFIKLYRAQLDEDDHDKMFLFNEVRRQAPDTVKFIQAMPLLKDRVQGVLLRGRAVKGDPLKRQREPQLVDQAGLLGKRSLLEGGLSEQSDVLERSKNTAHESQSRAEGIQDPITENALSTVTRESPPSSDVQTQWLRSKGVKTNSLIQQAPMDVQDNAPSMIATEADGDPYVEGLPSWEASVELDLSCPPSIPLTQEYENQLPLVNGTSSSKKSQARIRFEERLKDLRRTASQPERAPPHWRIRSSRHRQQALRVVAYPVRTPQKLLLKPMGDYTHKDPIFTKPMLTMRIPRRRQLGSERRAFDLPKKYMELKKERERSIRKAQARAVKLRAATEKLWDEQGARSSQHIVTAADATAFLEERLISHEGQGEKTAPERVDDDMQVDAVEEPVREKRQRSVRTDSAAEVKEAQEAIKNAQHSIDADQAAEVNNANPHTDASFLEAHRADAAKPAIPDEHLYTPWGQLGQFNEKDFVNPQDASKGR